ncbi:MAG: aminopeptidase [archaeon]
MGLEEEIVTRIDPSEKDDILFEINPNVLAQIELAYSLTEKFAKVGALSKICIFDDRRYDSIFSEKLKSDFNKRIVFSRFDENDLNKEKSKNFSQYLNHTNVAGQDLLTIFQPAFPGYPRTRFLKLKNGKRIYYTYTAKQRARLMEFAYPNHAKLADYIVNDFYDYPKKSWVSIGTEFGVPAILQMAYSLLDALWKKGCHGTGDAGDLKYFVALNRDAHNAILNVMRKSDYNRAAYVNGTINFMKEDNASGHEIKWKPQRFSDTLKEVIEKRHRHATHILVDYPSYSDFKANRSALSYSNYTDLCRVLEDALSIFLNLPREKMHNAKLLIGNRKNLLLSSKDGSLELRFSTDGRRALIDDEQKEGAKYSLNIPSGEVFIAPLKEKTNGKILFDEVFYFGKKIEGLHLTFKNGKVAKWSAARNSKVVAEMFDQAKSFGDTDSFPYMGEFGIGFLGNRPIGSPLLDEKQRNSFHIALGRNTNFYGDISCSMHIDLVYNTVGKGVLLKDEDSQELLINFDKFFN